MIPRPPTSTLFPYTTLFRSAFQTTAPPARRADFLTPRPPQDPGDRPDAYVPGRPPCGGSDSTATGQSERSEEHTSELQSHSDLVCRLLLEKKKEKKQAFTPS